MQEKFQQKTLFWEHGAQVCCKICGLSLAERAGCVFGGFCFFVGERRYYGDRAVFAPVDMCEVVGVVAARAVCTAVRSLVVCKLCGKTNVFCDRIFVLFPKFAKCDIIREEFVRRLFYESKKF